MIMTLVLALQRLSDLVRIGERSSFRQIPKTLDEGRWGASVFGRRDQFLLISRVIDVS